MKNTYKKRNYKCKCGEEISEYVWDNDIHDKKFECPSCGEELGFNQIKIKKVGTHTAIRTDTKNR